MKKILSVFIVLSIVILITSYKNNAIANPNQISNNNISSNITNNKIVNDEKDISDKTYCIIENTEEILTEEYINSINCIGYSNKDNCLEIGLSNYGTDENSEFSQCGTAKKNQVLKLDYTTVLKKGDSFEINIYDGNKNLIGSIGPNKKGTLKIKFYKNSQFYINTTAKNADFYLKITRSIIEDNSELDNSCSDTNNKDKKNSTKKEKEITSDDSYTIGNSIKINDLTFTINEIKTSQLNQSTELSDGNQFLYLDLTVENNAAEQKAMTSTTMFHLYGDNNMYNIVTPEPPNESINGLLNPGCKMSGKVCFQVPKDIKKFSFEIKPSMINKEKETINLTVK